VTAPTQVPAPTPAPPAESGTNAGEESSKPDSAVNQTAQGASTNAQSVQFDEKHPAFWPVLGGVAALIVAVGVFSAFRSTRTPATTDDETAPLHDTESSNKKHSMVPPPSEMFQIDVKDDNTDSARGAKTKTVQPGHDVQEEEEEEEKKKEKKKGQQQHSADDAFTAALSEDGFEYFISVQTGETAWELPANGWVIQEPSEDALAHDYLSDSAAAGADVFVACNTDEGDVYFANVETGETVWELPPAAKLQAGETVFV
jgi:hypothetical protein